MNTKKYLIPVKPFGRDYQAQGFTKTLAAANEAINIARLGTPENERKNYRSAIRRTKNGYAWHWVLR